MQLWGSFWKNKSIKFQRKMATKIKSILQRVTAYNQKWDGRHQHSCNEIFLQIKPTKMKGSITTELTSSWALCLCIDMLQINIAAQLKIRNFVNYLAVSAVVCCYCHLSLSVCHCRLSFIQNWKWEVQPMALWCEKHCRERVMANWKMALLENENNIANNINMCFPTNHSCYVRIICIM